MKISRILSFFIGVALVLPGCSLFQNVETGLIPENAINPDAVTVFVLDHTDETQIKKLQNLLERFPLDQLENLQNKEDEDYEQGQMIQDVLKGKWKIVGEMDLEIIGNNGEGLVVAAQFEEMEIVEKLLEDFGNEAGVEMEERDGIKYWSISGGRAQMAQYEDVLVFAITQEDLALALSNLKNGTGREEMNEGGLGYISLNIDSFADYFGDFELTGEVVTRFYADDNGLKFESAVAVADMEYFEETVGSKDTYRVEIVKSVPAEGIMFYSEEPNFGAYVQGFITGIKAGNLEPGTILSYEEAVDSFAKATGLTNEEVDDLAYLPFAFAVHDKGEIFPAISLYLKMSEGIEGTGKKLTMAIDKYLELMISEFDSMMGENGAGALKKDVKVVQGGGINRLYLDWSALPQEVVDGYNVIPGFDVSAINFEIYYGVTGSDVLVLALYPKFDQEFGKDALADDAKFKDAVKTVGGEYGVKVGYFNVDPMMEMVDKYMGMFKMSGIMTTEDIENYELVKAFVNTVDYMIGVSWLDGETLKSEDYIKLGEE